MSLIEISLTNIFHTKHTLSPGVETVHRSPLWPDVLLSSCRWGDSEHSGELYGSGDSFQPCPDKKRADLGDHGSRLNTDRSWPEELLLGIRRIPFRSVSLFWVLSTYLVTFFFVNSVFCCGTGRFKH